MLAAADGTFVVEVRWLMIAICTGQSSRPFLEVRPDGISEQELSGQEFSEPCCRKILGVEVLSMNLGEEPPVSVKGVAGDQNGRHKSCEAAGAAVGGTGLVVAAAFAGQRQTAGPRGSSHRPDEFGVKLLGRRMRLVEVAEAVDASRPWWWTTWSACGPLAASCAAAVLKRKSWSAICQEVPPRRYLRRQRLAGSWMNVRLHIESAWAAACDPAGSPTCFLAECERRSAAVIQVLPLLKKISTQTATSLAGWDLSRSLTSPDHQPCSKDDVEGRSPGVARDAIKSGDSQHDLLVQESDGCRQRPADRSSRSLRHAG